MIMVIFPWYLNCFAFQYIKSIQFEIKSAFIIFEYAFLCVLGWYCSSVGNYYNGIVLSCVLVLLSNALWDVSQDVIAV